MTTRGFGFGEEDLDFLGLLVVQLQGDLDAGALLDALLHALDELGVVHGCA